MTNKATNQVDEDHDPAGRRAGLTSMWRSTPFLALMIGVSLLAVGLVLTTTALAQEHRQAQSLQRDADQIATAFGAHFERARSLNLLLAQNQAIGPLDADEVDLGATNDALAYLQVLYPDSIGEACIIDEHGHELARVTEGVAAHTHELSEEEASAPFFHPTFDLTEGAVYQAAPYVSPDTGTWVISNSTWVELDDASRWIVHFEVSLDSFAEYLSTGGTDTHVAIVDRAEGRILLQDGSPLPGTDPAGLFPLTEWSHELAHGDSGAQGTISIDGHDAAYRIIDRAAGNANDWYVVEWTTARASLVPPWGGATIATIGGLLLTGGFVVLRRQQGALARAARLDHLTGLVNRKGMEEALGRAVESAAAGEDSVAVLMIDLDGFKQINDTLGHDSGDLVLQEIARRLFANVFEYDTAARIGGDEFAVVLRNLKQAESVAAVAHRLRTALIRPIEIDGVERFVGASIGAASYPDHGESAQTLLMGADAAMYRAKRNREGVRVYEAGTSIGAETSGRAAELSTAIESEVIEMAFQPQFSLETGALNGVEALARWDHPELGAMAPAQFVALAEEAGIIRGLTSLTLRKALDVARVWSDSGITMPVSINISGRVITDSTLPIEVGELLARRNLGADALIIEITETVFITDREVAVAVLRQLRGIGVRVQLDDFGTGYASFGALLDLPLDGIKVDRQLVTDRSDSGRRLLAVTIETARELGLEVIAEGVEDAETLERMTELGCDSAQGFHLAHPMTAAQFLESMGIAPVRAV
jgi:diguanylate cyclase (GGDEF)-like protein